MEQEKPRLPRTPEEAKRMRKNWTGIVSTHTRPNLNHAGINEQPGPDAPKQGMRRTRWDNN